MRKFSKSILTAGLLSPLSVYALGIGDITTNSGLNQILRAEIPLVGSQSEDPDNIRVGLASPAAFSKAGLDRPFYLSTLKFTPILETNGSITIKVSSEDPIKEPFVNFLLEVEWPKGTTMREFTILLDPPVTMTSQMAPVQTTAVKPTTPAPSERSRVAASASYAGNSRTVAQALPESYGPVKKNDNLWRIAGELIAKNDISREQMMLALYDENPQAFYKQNVNALKRGAVLSVPEREVIVRRSESQAKSEFNEQNRLWTSASKTTTSSVKAPEQTESDTTAAPDPAEPETTVSAESEGQLKLMTPTEGKMQAENVPVEGGAIDTPVGSTDPGVQANMAMEMAATLEQENEDFQNRLASLEAQVEKLQNQITLKDEQLAELQASAPKPQPTPAQPAPQPVEAENSNLPWYLGGGLVVLLLAWLLGRRRPADQTLPEPERAPKPVSVDDSEPATEEDSLPISSDTSDSIDVQDSTLLSEFSASEFDELTDGEQTADPLTETDVYIAYGRYQQAEDLMLGAIQDEPNNHAYQLKLLDIYFAAGKSDEFESYAKELLSLQRDEPELWDQICTMGRELCPESPIFGAPPEDPEAMVADEPEELTAEEPEEIVAEESIEFVSEEPEPGEIKLEDTDELEAPMVVDTDEKVEPETIDFANSIEISEEAAVSDNTEEVTQKDDFEFDFDLIQPNEEPVNDSGEEADEATTKLALVEAYIDMEDIEAAKETLNEVIEVGNDEQKEQARNMLANL